MNTGGDAAEQVVRFSLEGAEVAVRLTGTAARQVAAFLLKALKEENKTQGRARLTSMIRTGKRLQVFSIPRGDLRKFTSNARKYGVLYTVLRDREDRREDAPVDIIAREEDSFKIQRIIDRFRIGSADRTEIRSEPNRDISGQRRDRQREETFENPFPAETGKSRLSGPDSGKTDTEPGKAGRAETAAKAEKPSVRKKLAAYRAEAERYASGKERNHTAAPKQAEYVQQIPYIRKKKDRERN